MKNRIKTLVKRFEVAKVERATFEKHWNDIAEVISPAGAIFLEENPQQGEKTNKFVADSTGIHANELLSSGFFSLLTSPTAPWFNITTNDNALNQATEMKVWLIDVAKIMAYEIQRPQTGFATAMHEVYLEYGAYGNGTMFVTERNDYSSLLFQALPLTECVYVENNENFIDTIIRCYSRTAAQLLERFGIDAVSDKVRIAIEKGEYEAKFKVLHFIMPNVKASKLGFSNSSLPFASIYIEKEECHILAESGFEEQPFMAARFYKMPHEIYGRGPGSSALSDLKMLQEMMITTLRGAQKMVDPPMQMPDNGFITPPRVGPGNMNYYQTGSDGRIEPLLTGGRPDLGLEMTMDVRNRIREMFFVDQLQLNTGPQMTATEVLQRTEEKLRLMGPVVGRASTELLSPLISRVFGLLYRAGKLPPAPDVFAASRAKLKIVYTSPIVKAQEQVSANGLLRVSQLVLPFMGPDPTAFDVFNVDSIARGTGEMFNIDPRFFRTEDEVAEVRGQRMQAQQQQMGAQQLKDTGIGLNNLANAGQVLGEQVPGGMMR